MDFLRVGLVRYKERLESRDVIVFNLRKGRIYMTGVVDFLVKY